MTKIVCAFPGTGKSFLAQHVPEILDSDSSHWPKAGFPENYLDHLQEAAAGPSKLILASSHREVRMGLWVRKVPFILAYPDISLKDEYLGRYAARGSSGAFVTLVHRFWDEWLTDCRSQEGCTHVVLRSGEYLSDVLGLLGLLPAGSQ